MKLMLCNNDSKFSTGIKNILKIIYTFYNITNKVLIVFFFLKNYICLIFHPEIVHLDPF